MSESNDSTARVLTWDEYFHGLSVTVSLKSKDPKAQVGAVIVNDDRLVVSTGFNGLARKLPDDTELLEDREKKLQWIFHAEQNAILNAARLGVSPLGCTLYVNKFPCFTCCQAMAQAGIVRIFTLDDDYWKHDPIDGDHSGKRYVLRQANILVHAPNHRDFQSRPPTLRPPVKTKSPSPDSSLGESVPKKDGTAG